MTSARELARNAIAGIVPADSVEEEHRRDALDWFDSTTSIWRAADAESQRPHLVSYFLPFDAATKSVVLIDHVRSGLRLPPGGHVEVDEPPVQTAVREAAEELGVDARFAAPWGEQPLFLTVTDTVGANPHTDVSLWYLMEGNPSEALEFDRREMTGYQWVTLDEVLDADPATLDPHLPRFASKVNAVLARGCRG